MNNNNNNNILNISKTFGVGSSRYISCLPFNFKTQIIQESVVNTPIQLDDEELEKEKQYLLTVPIGSGIVHWNILKKKRSPSPTTYKQLHSDVITTLIRVKPIKQSIAIGWFNKYFHLSSSYSGEIGIWDNEWNEILKYQLPNQLEDNKCMHISIDESYDNFPSVKLVVSNEHGNCKITILEIDFTNPTHPSISILHEVTDKLLFFAEMVDANHFITVQQDVGKQGFQQDRTLKIGDKIVNILKFNCETGEIVNELKDTIGTQECTILVKNQSYYNSDGSGNKQCIISRGRVLQVIDCSGGNNFKISQTIYCQGSGLMKDILFYDNLLLVPCSNSDLLLYSSETSELISKFKSSESHGEVYSLKWSIPGKRLWLFDESGIHSIYLNDSLKLVDEQPPQQQVPLDTQIDYKNYSLLYHQITCCGIDFNQQGNQVACGDFLGNIMIWNIDENVESHTDTDGPAKQYCFGIPIRSVSWCNDIILIGLMDGSLMSWNISGSEEHEPVLIVSLQDGITCIKWEIIESSSLSCSTYLIAVGTTGGNLSCFKRLGTEFTLEWSQLAHQPVVGPQDLNFGSINKFAEIWSLTFHPSDNELIATCSEDQTTIIWNRVTKEKIKVLTGHTTAVTCVDWVNTTDGKCLLATCADDQTIRIWETDTNTNHWKEILVVNTNGIGEWHTVTYISLIVSEQSSTLVVCATQNGWIFVWDINSGNKIYSKRVHMGSIEGLRWNKISNKIISCSSDCLIHVYDIAVNK